MSQPGPVTMIRQNVTYYCDECKKEITSVEMEMGSAIDLLEAGVFERPERGRRGGFQSQDIICKDCMLKELAKWTEDVRGH